MHEVVTVKRQVYDCPLPEKMLTHLSAHHLTVSAALEKCYFNFQCCQYGSPRSCSILRKQRKDKGGLRGLCCFSSSKLLLLVLVPIYHRPKIRGDYSSKVINWLLDN